jgi:hemoglobin-like flavoprotein
MNTQQVALVQQSFGKVRPRADELAALFYLRLFAIDPTTRPLFPADLAAQRVKLVGVLVYVVNGLGDLSGILDQVQALGRRHVGYGVSERHYTSVGAALLWALEEVMGPRFTAEVREAWVAAYGVLSVSMIAAARDQEALSQPQEA